MEEIWKSIVCNCFEIYFVLVLKWSWCDKGNQIGKTWGLQSKTNLKSDSRQFEIDLSCFKCLISNT